MKVTSQRPRALALMLFAFAAARLCAADRAPAPAPAEPPPAVILPNQSAASGPEAKAPVSSATTTPVPTPAAGATEPAATAGKSEPAESKPGGKNAATKSASIPPPLSPRFLQVRDRIKVLFVSRDEARPPLDPRHNPFRTQPIVPAEPAPVAASPAASAGPGGPALPGAAPVPSPAAPGLTPLKQAVALLRIGGFVDLKNRAHVSINGLLYREGDVVKVTLQNQPVLLRITKLTRTSLTLSLNDAETTLKF